MKRRSLTPIRTMRTTRTARRRPWGLGAWALLVLALPGRAEPPPPPAPLRPMALPAAWLREAESLPVQDRKPGQQRGLGVSAADAFRLGPHALTNVERSALATQHLALGPLDRVQTRESLAYRFQGATTDWDGRCERRSRSSVTHRLGLLPDAVTTLHCTCRSGPRQVEFKLSDEWRPAGGELLIDGQPLQLQQQDVPGSEVNLASPAPAFLLRDEEDRLLGAIDTFHPGRVWRHRALSADAGEPMACLAAALLLSYPN